MEVHLLAFQTKLCQEKNNLFYYHMTFSCGFREPWWLSYRNIPKEDDHYHRPLPCQSLLNEYHLTQFQQECYPTLYHHELYLMNANNQQLITLN